MLSHSTEKRRRGSSTPDTLSGSEEPSKRNRSNYSRPHALVENATATDQSRMLIGNVDRDNIHGNVHTTINNFNGHVPTGLGDTSANEASGPQTSNGLSQSEKALLKEHLRFSQLDGRLQNLRQAELRTCAWIKKREDYKKWLNSDSLEANNGFFWIKGNPGTGKSITMKYLYQSMRNSKVRGPQIVISFFFNARGNDFEKSVLGMYRSLLYNLFDKEPFLLEALDHCQRSGYLNILETGWGLEMLKEVFAEVVLLLRNGSKRTYCFVDALDECPVSEIRDMINHFEGLVGSTDSNSFRVCFSSRHYPQVIIRTKLTMTLEKERHHDEDIKTYINSRLQVDDDVDIDLLDTIKTQILAKSSGIFLWVTLVVHQLNELEIQPDRMDVVWQHLQEIPKAAKEIPAPGEAITLYGLFKDVIKKDNKGIEEFIRLAQIVFRAERPLRPKELYVVLRECYETSFEVNQVSDETIAKNVLRTSKGLAEVTRSDQPTVQFIHETVREFLREGGLQSIFEERRFVDGHQVLKDSCLKQLRAPLAKDLSVLAAYQSGSMRRGVRSHIFTQQQQDFQEEATIKFPFLEYASQNLLSHTNTAQRLGISQRSFIESFPSERWIPIHNIFEKFKKRRYKGIETPVLYIFASQGCSSLIQLLPASGRDPIGNIKGEEFPSALICAIVTGHLETAYVLVGLEPPVLTSDTASTTKSGISRNEKRSLLQCLTLLGNLPLLRKVLEDGHCRNETVDMTKLKTIEVLDLLIEFSMVPDFCAGRNDQGGQKAHPRHSNLPFLRQALVQDPRLLTEEIWAGRGMLDHAVHMNHPSLVSIYFEYAGGSQKNIDDYLHCAVATGPLDMVRDAYWRGANVNAQDEHGQTAVHIALWWLYYGCRPDTGLSRHERADVAQLCLSQPNIDYSIRDDDHNAVTDLVLSMHNRSYQPKVANWLIQGGVDPNTLVGCLDCKNHQIPFLTASFLFRHSGDPWRDMISISQCDLDRRDNLGRTALSWCFAHQHGIGFRHRHVYWKNAGWFGKALLESLRVDVNARDNMGYTILERFIRHISPTQDEAFQTFVGDFFRAEHLDPNLITSNGQTPLQLIISLYETWPAEINDKYSQLMIYDDKTTRYLRGSDKGQAFLAHLTKALGLLLGTKKVNLTTQRECVSQAPPSLRVILLSSLAACDGVFDDGNKVGDDLATGSFPRYDVNFDKWSKPRYDSS